jgi:anaerobic C4-dicarboxylate transporter
LFPSLYASSYQNGISQEEANALAQSYMSNKDSLMMKLEKCPDYRRIKNEREKQAHELNLRLKSKNKNQLSISLYGFIGIIAMGLIISSLYLQFNQQKLGKQNWYVGTNVIISTLTTLTSSAFAAIVSADITRRFTEK